MTLHKAIEAEVWKDIPGYHGMYRVSDHGRIWSAPNYKYKEGRVIKGSINSQGYLGFCLKMGDKATTKKVHRLVMETFVGKSDLDVNHKNSIKTDNRLENLEYVHRRENVNHAYLNKDGMLAGVYKDKKSFVARIKFGEKIVRLGVFDTEKEAHACYIGAVKMLEQSKYASDAGVLYVAEGE